MVRKYSGFVLNRLLFYESPECGLRYAHVCSERQQPCIAFKTYLESPLETFNEQDLLTCCLTQLATFKQETSIGEYQLILKGAGRGYVQLAGLFFIRWRVERSPRKGLFAPVLR